MDLYTIYPASGDKMYSSAQQYQLLCPSLSVGSVGKEILMFNQIKPEAMKEPWMTKEMDKWTKEGNGSQQYGK